MKLSPEQISQKILALVTQFNNLIENIAEPQYKQIWKVSVPEGSVAFGSARENWALSFPYMQKKSIKFLIIRDITGNIQTVISKSNTSVSEISSSLNLFPSF